MPAGFIDLPFRKQHPYLGVVLSYEKFEKLSLQARIKQKAGQISADSFLYSGPSTFHPSSDCSYGIPASFSTIRYGLASTGLPARGSDQLRQLVAKQVRLVLKSPSWITHEPTAELCRRYMTSKILLHSLPKCWPPGGPSRPLTWVRLTPPKG